MSDTHRADRHTDWAEDSNFAAFFYFTWVLAYAVDSYSANLAEWLVM